jgi:hypothetical protein
MEADSRVVLTADFRHGAHDTTFLSIFEAPHSESEYGARVSDHHTVIMRVDNKYECHRTWPRDSERIRQEPRTPAPHRDVQDTPLHLVLATDHAKCSAFEQLLHLVHLRRRQTRRGRQSAQ